MNNLSDVERSLAWAIAKQKGVDVNYLSYEQERRLAAEAQSAFARIKRTEYELRLRRNQITEEENNA